ncbi:MAG: beta-galactosidase [Candidatus Pelagisphaera sp.]|jgi:beta-galactosidase
MRGVNRHDIHPEVGRANREEHYLEDIELMKKGNINAVRTSHYPPHPMFLDLCDEYGIYVVCEVPFGFGDDNLKHPCRWRSTWRDSRLAIPNGISLPIAME